VDILSIVIAEKNAEKNTLKALGATEVTNEVSVAHDLKFTADNHLHDLGLNGALVNFGTTVELIPGETYRVFLVCARPEINDFVPSEYTLVARTSQFMGMNAVCLGNYSLTSLDAKDDTGEPFCFASSPEAGGSALGFDNAAWNGFDWTVGIIHVRKSLAFNKIRLIGKDGYQYLLYVNEDGKLFAEQLMDE